MYILCLVSVSLKGDCALYVYYVRDEGNIGCFYLSILCIILSTVISTHIYAHMYIISHRTTVEIYHVTQCILYARIEKSRNTCKKYIFT